MSRKKPRKKKVVPKPPGAVGPKRDEAAASDQWPEERDLDFGGLPDRDLKKNLGGCG